MRTTNKQSLVKDPIIGAIIGDVCGSKREGLRNSIFSTKIALFPANSHITDDSVLTIAIAKWLTDIEASSAKDCLFQWGKLYPHAGYGSGFKYFMKTGESYRSTHNGAAMRVSPVALKAASIDECIKLATESAAPTHDTP